MEIINLAIIGLLNLIVISIFSLTGGIGLIMRPIIMFLGYSPQITIGTSRISPIFGNILSQVILHKSKKIDWKLVLWLAPINVAGGLTGIFILTSLDDVLLRKLIGSLLILAGFIFWLNKKIGIEKSKPHLGKYHYLISWPIIFIIGSLLVLVGGIGPLARLLFIFGYGKTHIEAAAIQKAINFWQTIITAVIFVSMMFVDWKLLLILMTTSTLGNYIGTKLTLEKGEKYLRAILLLVIFASGIKLIFFP